MASFIRDIWHTLRTRLQEPRRFVQVLTGPRQVGKTTLAEYIADQLHTPSHYASADGVLQEQSWIEQQWEVARFNLTRHKECLLILDEIQKITQWSEIVKKLWDADTKAKRNVKVLLLGSSPLLIQQGLTESLAGRFETITTTHWSFTEMRKAFNYTLDQYIYFGGYPGSASLIKDEQRWKNYIIDSLIETTISRDILLLNAVHKPALLRRLFHLCCEYSSQILSYQKMMGQLQDAGNTTTLAHYLQLLSGAGIVTGLEKYAGQTVRQRASSPKLQVLNSALVSAQSSYHFKEAKADLAFWGRLVESTVGAHLLSSKVGTPIKVFYWREGQYEVDYVLAYGKRIIALEVKSGHHKESLSGMEMFYEKFKPERTLLVGTGGIALDLFLETPISYWFS